MPFIRRPFHYFLSDKNRLAWLNRRIQFGQIFQDDPDGPMYPTLTRDRAFIFVSRFTYPKCNIWPFVGEEILCIEPSRTDKARSYKPTEYSYPPQPIPGLEVYRAWKEVDSKRFGPMSLTFHLGKVIWHLKPDMFSLSNRDPDYETRSLLHSTITTTGLTVRLKAAPRSPGPRANTGPKARLRYSALSPERQESIGRSSSKKT